MQGRVKGLPPLYRINRHFVGKEKIQRRLRRGGRPELGRIHIDHGQINPLPAQADQSRDPFGTPGGGDDGQGVEPAEVRLQIVNEPFQSQIALGADGGQSLHQAAQVRRAGAGPQQPGIAAAGRQAHRGRQFLQPADDGGGQGNAQFLGIVQGILPQVDAALQIQQHPGFGREAHIKLFDHQVVHPGGIGPVDLPKAVAVGIFPDAGGFRGDVVGAAGNPMVAGQPGKAGRQVGQRFGRRKDDIRLGFQKAAAQPKQAERVLTGNFNAPGGKDAAPGQIGLNAPAAGLIPHQGNAPAGGVAGQVGNFLDFQPGLGQAQAVDHLNLPFQIAAHLPPGRQPGQPHFQPPQVNPGPEQAQAQGQQEDIEKAVKKGKAGAGGVESHHRQQDQNPDIPLVQAHGCSFRCFSPCSIRQLTAPDRLPGGVGSATP